MTDCADTTEKKKEKKITLTMQLSRSLVIKRTYKIAGVTFFVQRIKTIESIFMFGDTNPMKTGNELVSGVEILILKGLSLLTILVKSGIFLNLNV